MQTPETPAALQPANPQPPITNPPPTFWQAAWGVIVRPQATLAYVCRERKLAWGLWLLAFFSLSGALIAWVVPQPEIERLLPIPPRQFRDIYALIVLVVAPLVSLSAAYGYHVTARWLKAKGAFGSFFAGYIMAGVPGVLLVPFQLLPVVAGEAGNVVSTIASASVAIWIAVLDVLAVKINYNMTTGKTLAVFFIPWLVLLGVAIIGSIIIVIFTVMALGAIG